MVIRFGKKIHGNYKDYQTGISTSIDKNSYRDYFDSNFYPTLLSWLSYDTIKEAEFDIFDFNPKGKTGILKVKILNVNKGTYQTERNGVRPVWIVKVADEISSNTVITYQLDQVSRQLYKQTIVSGNRKMEMKLIED